MYIMFGENAKYFTGAMDSPQIISTSFVSQMSSEKRSTQAKISINFIVPAVYAEIP